MIEEGLGNANLIRRPDMVVSSPGIARMTSCPTRSIWMSTVLGDHSYGECAKPYIASQI